MVHPPCLGYKIIFSDETKKDLKKLENQTISKIFKKVKDLTSVDSHNLNIKKLKTKAPLYRLRAVDYRIVYSIKHEKIVVYVVAIGHRKNIYDILDRRLKSLIYP